MGKNEGKLFEQQFQKSCEKQNICCIRLVDSNKFNFGEGTRFTPDNICDFICFDGEKLLLVELKHTKGTSISFNQPVTEKGDGTYMIKPKQVKNLLKHTEFINVLPILILDYGDRTNSKGDIIKGGTYAIHIDTFVDWCNAVAKKSINQEDCKMIGTEIERIKKKVNYIYDVKGLIERF